MSALELKVPPPVVAAVVAFLMWAATEVVPSFRVAMAVRISVAIALVAAGGAFGIAGLVAFAGARTTFEPQDPRRTTSLVVTSVYRFTRNPMYVGLMSGLLGWAAYLANLGALLASAVFVAYMDRFQIRPEEDALTELFGEEYSAYRARVRRWL